MTPEKDMRLHRVGYKKTVWCVLLWNGEILQALETSIYLDGGHSTGSRFSTGKSCLESVSGFLFLNPGKWERVKSRPQKECPSSSSRIQPRASDTIPPEQAFLPEVPSRLQCNCAQLSSTYPYPHSNVWGVDLHHKSKFANSRPCWLQDWGWGHSFTAFISFAFICMLLAESVNPKNEVVEVGNFLAFTYRWFWKKLFNGSDLRETLEDRTDAA